MAYRAICCTAGCAEKSAGYSSLSVRMQLGSKPTSGMLFSAYGASWSNKSLPNLRTGSVSPLDKYVRPQHRRVTTKGRSSICSSNQSASRVTSGVKCVLNVSTKSTKSGEWGLIEASEDWKGREENSGSGTLGSIFANL